jgi:hypothetical protein
VQVLHHPQQRPARGQPLDHPQQQLEQPPLAGAGHLGCRGRLDAPAQVGKQPAQVRAGGPGDRRQLGRIQLDGQAPQRLDDRRERHALLAQRHAAATQHPQTLPAGGGGQLLDQPGLADPRLPAEQRHQRLVVAVGGTRQQVAQPRQLLGAADEPPGRDLVGHDAKYAPPVLSRAGRRSGDPYQRTSPEMRLTEPATMTTPNR